MQIIRESRIEAEHISYYLEYKYNNISILGYCFQCDIDGNVLLKYYEERVNYKKCTSDTNIELIGIRKYVCPYTIIRTGICDVCGSQVELNAPINKCMCGAEYNKHGHNLFRRSQWSEKVNNVSDKIFLRVG